MAEFYLIKNFYPDGSPLVYRVHGETHPEFGDAWQGYVWVQALSGDIAGTWFNRLVAAPAAWLPAAPRLAVCLPAAIWRWSDSKPEGYEMKEDEKL